MEALFFGQEHLPHPMAELGVFPPLRVHVQLGIVEKKVAKKSLSAHILHLRGATLQKQPPNPDGVKNIGFRNPLTGGGICAQKIVVRADSLENRRFCPVKEVIIHQKVFVIADIPGHPGGKSLEKLPAVQLSAKAQTNLPVVKELPEPSSVILDAKLSRLVDILNAPVGEVNLVAAMGNVRAGGLGIFQEPGVHRRLHQVVPVHKADPVPRSCRRTGKPGRGNAAVFLKNAADIGMLIHKFPDNPGGFVLRAVVHHDNFQLRVGLRQEAVQAFTQVGG